MSGETDLTQAGFDAIAEAMDRDGSSTAFLYMDELGVRLENGHVTLRLGAGHDRTLTRMLRPEWARAGSCFSRAAIPPSCSGQGNKPAPVKRME